MGGNGTKSQGRREFLRAGTAAAAGLAAGYAHGGASEEIKVGLIGCGGRGNGAATDAMNADKRVRIVAIADVFPDRLEQNRQILAKMNPDQYKVADERVFKGFEAYKQLLGLELDYVILATPPHFRPQHLAAAIDAGKHVFMEKPVAVDPVGCRSVMESGKKAAEKGLSIAAGTQRRHEKVYLETYKRIQDGAIGKPVAARCYWNQGQLWYKDRESSWNPMEWMIRDWVNWAWLSGDHIVEQHVHNIDVVNWFFSKDGTVVHPVRAVGSGGRVHRVTGDQYDFFSVDYEYADGSHLASYCRQINGCDNNVTESVVGEKGSTRTSSSNCRILGEKPAHFQASRIKQTNPYVQEHIDLIDSIVHGKKLNEANNIATSTLTAIMGRMAAYTGRMVTWDEVMKSNLRLGPAEYAWDIPLPKVEIPRAGRA